MGFTERIHNGNVLNGAMYGAGVGALAGAAAFKGGASTIDAALVGGTLSGGVSMGLNYVNSPGPIWYVIIHDDNLKKGYLWIRVQ